MSSRKREGCEWGYKGGLVAHSLTCLTSSNAPVGRCERSSPGYVEVVAFVDDFFRARAALTDTLRVGRPSSGDKARSWSDEIDSAASEVVAARDATHSAIALSSPVTAGNSEVRMGCQETVQVELSMRLQAP